ncbi:hypothetical protein ZWY2020_005987 [Hordeum vulgare]|nr:hypothetical protein ZWY2020_005987 [Hordeum vulgare]
MPLKFSMALRNKEPVTRFNKSNRLDRKDMIMFPVLENIDKSKPIMSNHYWVFNVNLRDRRFEVLDSWRTLDKKTLDTCARSMVASIRALWETHYPKSHISMDNFPLAKIDVPKQTNE